MTRTLKTALATALLMTAPIALSPAAHAQALSRPVGLPLQKAMQLRSGPQAIALIGQARAAARTPAERTAVSKGAVYVYANSGRWADAIREAQASGAPPSQLAGYYYRAGQYDQAIAAARRSGGTEMQLLIAQAYVKKGDKRSAAAAYQQLIRTAGPRTEYLQNLAGLQFTYDKQGYLNTVKQLIKQDPSPANYKALLFNLKGQSMSDQARLTLYQLIRQTNNMTEATDVQDAAKLAIINGLPGVAVAIVSDGIKGNVVPGNDPTNARILQVGQQQQAAAIAAVPRLPNTPDGRMKAGNALFGAGNWAGAAAAYRVAAVAGNNGDFPRMLEGISLVRAGNSAGAQQVFNGVAQASTFYNVAQIWSLYAATHR